MGAEFSETKNKNSQKEGSGSIAMAMIDVVLLSFVPGDNVGATDAVQSGEERKSR
jgi:hypothetical protein